MMNAIAESALALLKKNETELRAGVMLCDGAVSIIRDSIHKCGSAVFMLGREAERQFLLIVADYDRVMPQGFVGREFKLSDGGVALECDCSIENGIALRKLFPWLNPVSLSTAKRAVCAPSASLLDFVDQYDFFPVLLGDTAVWGWEVFARDCRNGYAVGSFGEVDAELPVGASLVFAVLKSGACDDTLATEYALRTFVVGREAVRFSAEDAARCSCYAADLERLVRLGGILARRKVDLGVAFADARAGLCEHLFAMRELRRRGVALAALKPGAGEARIHAAIASAYGGYRLLSACGATVSKENSQLPGKDVDNPEKLYHITEMDSAAIARCLAASGFRKR